MAAAAALTSFSPCLIPVSEARQGRREGQAAAGRDRQLCGQGKNQISGVHDGCARRVCTTTRSAGGRSGSSLRALRLIGL